MQNVATNGRALGLVTELSTSEAQEDPEGAYQRAAASVEASLRRLLLRALDNVQLSHSASLPPKAAFEIELRVRVLINPEQQSQSKVVALWPGRSETETGIDSRGAAFRRDGDYWVISYQGRPFRLCDSKGLGYIAKLLRHPDLELHALELYGVGDPASGDSQAPDILADGGDAGPILDDRARAAYKSRLEHLRSELDEARGFNDLARASAISQEIEFLAGQLAGAFGLGGRERRTASTVERARQTVSKAIKAALARIAQNDASLGHHLATTIKTGAFCCYNRDPGAPIAWRT